MLNEKELYVCDADGNIVDKISSEDKYVKLSEGDRILRKNAIQYLSETTDIKYSFIKVNPLAYGDLVKRYSIFAELTKHVGYMDNILEYSNGKNIRRKDVTKVCGVSESTAKRQLKGLIEEDVIHSIKKNKNYYLIVNPWICYKGKKIYMSLYDEFKLSHWRNKIEVVQK